MKGLSKICKPFLQAQEAEPAAVQTETEVKEQEQEAVLQGE